jgi:hypothetical protein
VFVDVMTVACVLLAHIAILRRRLCRRLDITL